MGERRSLHPAVDGSSHPAEPAHGCALAQGQQPHSSRRLRILCLHGFRQSARGFEGRTHALRRRLKDLADCVFIDAPHELPAWGRQQEGAQACTLGGQCSQVEPDLATAPAAAGGTVNTAGAEARPQQHGQQPQQHRAPAAKWAWLLVPEQHAALQQPATACSASSGGCTGDGQDGGSLTTPAFASDPGQYEQQTAGWRQSQAAIAQALEELGPFDGVLGLSQGAAVAAVIVAQQWQAQQQEPQQELQPADQAQQQAQAQQQEPSSPPPQQQQAEQAQQQAQSQQQERSASGRCCRGGSSSDALPAAPPLQFAVLCSGYRSRVPAHARLLSEAVAAGGIAVPSLHVFGGGGADRQISAEESAALAGCFHPAQRSEVRHDAGHLIPSSGPALAALRDFLLSQQQRLALGRRPDPQHKPPT